MADPASVEMIRVADPGVLAGLEGPVDGSLQRRGWPTSGTHTRRRRTSRTSPRCGGHLTRPLFVLTSSSRGPEPPAIVRTFPGPIHAGQRGYPDRRRRSGGRPDEPPVPPWHGGGSRFDPDRVHEGGSLRAPLSIPTRPGGGSRFDPDRVHFGPPLRATADGRCADGDIGSRGSHLSGHRCWAKAGGVRHSFLCGFAQCSLKTTTFCGGKLSRLTAAGWAATIPRSCSASINDARDAVELRTTTGLGAVTAIASRTAPPGGGHE